MKRLISVLTSLALMSTFAASTLSGCGKKDKMTAHGVYAENITNGEWLKLINDRFNFETQITEEPFFDDINAGSPYFEDVQIAVDMEVIPEDYEKLELDDKLTNEFCAVTLAGAIHREYRENVYVDDIDDCDYPERIKTVVGFGIMPLDDDSCFNPDDVILYIDAAECLEAAHYVMSSLKYEKPCFEYELNDDVIDFVGLSTIESGYDKDYSVDQSYVNEKARLLDAVNFDFNPNTGVITADDVDKLGFKVGGVAIIPDDSESTGITAVKIVEIKKNPDGTSTVITEVPMLSDIYGELGYEESVEPDMTQVRYYDENGKPIVMKSESGSASQVSNTPGQGGVVQLSNSGDVEVVPLDTTFDNGLQKDSFTIPLGKNMSIKVATEKRGFSLSFNGLNTVHDDGNDPGHLWKTNWEKRFKTTLDRYKNAKDKETIEKMKSKWDFGVNGEFKFKVDNITFHNQLDLDRTKLLKIPCGVNYMKSSVSFDTEESVSAALKFDYSLTLFKAHIPTGVPLLDLEITFTLKFSATGKIELVLTQKGWEHGIEFRNGSIQRVAEKPKCETKIKGDINAELTLGAKAALVIVSSKLASAYFEAAGGVGFDMDFNFKTYEEPNEAGENEIVKSAWCSDIKLYIVLKLSVGANIFNFRYDKSFSILNKDNATFARWHMEDLHIVDHCTIDAAGLEAKGIEPGDCIELDKSSMELLVGEEGSVSVVKFPAKYNLKEMLVGIDTQDNDVLEIQNTKNVISKETGAIAGDVKARYDALRNLTSGGRLRQCFEFNDGNSTTVKFKGLKKGDITLTFMTKNHMKSASCTIHVVEEKEDPSFSVFEDNEKFKLSTDVLMISPNGSAQLEIVKMPDGYSKSDVKWRSDDTSVATIDQNGKVTAKKRGVTAVYAETKDGKYSFRCTVSVFNDASSGGGVSGGGSGGGGGTAW